MNCGDGRHAQECQKASSGEVSQPAPAKGTLLPTLRRHDGGIVRACACLTGWLVDETAACATPAKLLKRQNGPLIARVPVPPTLAEFINHD
jgi:hypothetical protein